MHKFYDKKVVICHTLCHNLEMWKLQVILVVTKLLESLKGKERFISYILTLVDTVKPPYSVYPL